jgi:hypothetical protein
LKKSISDSEAGKELDNKRPGDDAWSEGMRGSGWYLPRLVSACEQVIVLFSYAGYVLTRGLCGHMRAMLRPQGVIDE